MSNDQQLGLFLLGLCCTGPLLLGFILGLITRPFLARLWNWIKRIPIQIKEILNND